MSRFFRDGWDFGIVTMLVGLPVAAVLAYIIGASFWELITHPLRYWQLWLFLVLWYGPITVRWFRKQPIDDGSGGYVQAGREIEREARP